MHLIQWYKNHPKPKKKIEIGIKREEDIIGAIDNLEMFEQISIFG